MGFFIILFILYGTVWTNKYRFFRGKFIAIITSLFCNEIAQSYELTIEYYKAIISIIILLYSDEGR